MLFGLIMVLTFTGSLSVAQAGREDVRAMLIGALGCNIAWGIIDAVLYLMACLGEKGHGLGVYRAVRTAKDVESLLPLGPAVRIVKGAYLEPPDVAYPKKSDVDENLPAMHELAQAEGALGGALGKLLAVFEQYPDLKANQNVHALQEELSSTENRVAFARQAFNDAVMSYNTKRESFPDNVFAGMFAFGAAELLASTESAEERKAPKVSFT